MTARIIAVANCKGGAGKTTLTRNLAAVLAQAGQRVLIVDADPQCSITTNCGVNFTDIEYSLYDAIVAARTAPTVDLRRTIWSLDTGEDLVPAVPDFQRANVELVSYLRPDIVLRRLLAPLQHDYDYILIDTMPYIGLIVDNALMAAHEVLIPMPPAALAIQSLKQLIDRIALIQTADFNPALRVLGMVFMGVDSRKSVHQDAVAYLTKVYSPQMRIFATQVHHRKDVEEAAAARKSVTAYAPRSESAQEFLALAQEVQDAQA